MQNNAIEKTVKNEAKIIIIQPEIVKINKIKDYHDL